MCGRGLCDIITLSVLQRGVHPGGGAQEGHRCPGGWVPGAREEQPDSPPGVAPPARTCLLLMTSHPVMCESEQQLPHSGVGELWTLKRFRERVFIFFRVIGCDGSSSWQTWRGVCVSETFKSYFQILFMFWQQSNKLIFFKTKRLTKRQNETEDQNLISKQDTREQSSLFRLIQQQCILGVGSEYSFCVHILLLFSHLFFSTKFKWIKSAGRTIKLFYLFLCKNAKYLLYLYLLQ